MEPVITWPAECDPKKHWPCVSEDPWATLDRALYRKTGTRMSALVEHLGGPKAILLDRTQEDADQWILAFFDRQKERPVRSDNPNLDHWLVGKGSSLRRRCDELGLPSLRISGVVMWASEDELRAVISTRSARQYIEDRKVNIIDRFRFPGLSAFKNVYGKTYRVLRDGARVYPTEEEICVAVRGLSVREYNARYAAARGNYPVASRLSKIYGKTFNEFRDGYKWGALKWADIEDVRRRIRDLRMDEYDALRGSWGPEYPCSGRFRVVYKMSYQKLRDGRANEEWVSLEEFRKVAKGLTCSQYDEQRATFGNKYPPVGGLRRVYGKTFTECRDGRRANEKWVSLEEFRKVAKGLTNSQYTEQRATFGNKYPSAVFAPKLYGLTWNEIQGKPKHGSAESVSIETFRAAIQGVSSRSYRKQWARLGAGYPSITRVRKVYGKSYIEIRDGVDSDRAGGVSAA